MKYIMKNLLTFRYLRACIISVLLLTTCATAYVYTEEVLYSTGNWEIEVPCNRRTLFQNIKDITWGNKGFGNHRAVIRVSENVDAVWLHIPWRRRDHEPEKKNIILIDATTGNHVMNVIKLDINREYGDIVFQPATVPGDYYLYYMPYVIEGSTWRSTHKYLEPEDTAECEWLQRNKLLKGQLVEGGWKKLPKAKLLEIEAINEFHRFDPMEIIATEEEMKTLLKKNENEPYLLFLEDRIYLIRMKDDIPLRWIKSGPSRTFEGEACRNEYYTFQIGIFASGQTIENVTVAFGDLTLRGGAVIPASALNCFNLGGKDWLGKPFTKTVSVEKGKVQPLWFSINVPKNAQPGDYNGWLTIGAKNSQSSKIEITLRVKQDILEDKGDSELWRHSRLR